MNLRNLGIIFLVSSTFSAVSQVQIVGKIVDSNTDQALPFVNIGIRKSNLGTVSMQNGNFSVTIPANRLGDTLTFSMVGFHELKIPISHFQPNRNTTVKLIQKVTALKVVTIVGEKLVEKKYGIKKRGLIHFTDGIFKPDDTFEIGQLIKLGNQEVKIASVNLHINSSRPDSASFRINFYRYEEENNQPGERIVERSIIQRHPIHQGWLNFDLTRYDIILKGKVFVSIEFIPEHKEGIKQIYYEVKLGGASKSFFRRNSQGRWTTPPHHYCLYVTALVDKHTPDEPDEKETTPAFKLKSDFSKEPFSIFVRLPKGYYKSTKRKYPILYLLDGNAFFDPISSSVQQLYKKNQLRIDPIVVGIGYENAYVMDSLRDRDYTFPKALPEDSFRLSGGGEKFYQFIKTAVKQHIEQNYRADTTNRTIMGHSLGGYFVLYALLQNLKGDGFFNNYVAASPSIWYSNYYLKNQFQGISNKNRTSGLPNLFITIGTLEIKGDPDNKFTDFTRMLSSLEFLHAKPIIYQGMEHMGTAIPSFEDGVKFILRDKPTN